jgi:hypothetical protein
VVRAARIAEEALRSLLHQGLPPEPEAFAREYERARARLEPEAPPRRSHPIEDPRARRVAALLAAALAAVGAADERRGPSCVELAARILAGADPLGLAAEIEQALVPPPAGAKSDLRWCETLGEALRHLLARLPPTAAHAAELAELRAMLCRARGAELEQVLGRLRATLSRSVLE